MRHLFRYGFLVAVIFTFAHATELAADEPGPGRVDGESLFKHDWQWQGPVKKLTEEDIRQRLASRFQIGARRFPQRPFQETLPGDGLGPLHNATSCAQCHVDGGGSSVQQNVTLLTIDPRSDFLSKRIRNVVARGPSEYQYVGVTQGDLGSDQDASRERDRDTKMLMRFFPGLLADGPSNLENTATLSFSTVVHDQSTRQGYDAIRNRLRAFVPGGIDDQWFVSEKRESSAIARQPVIAGRFESIDYYLSQRNAPALWGIGSIDAIQPVRLASLAKRQAKASNGKITGRLAGKFGWRGQVQTVAEFVSAACAGELGLNQPSGATQPNDAADPRYSNPGRDISPSQILKLTSFVSSIPRPEEHPDPAHGKRTVFQGEKLFDSVGCNACHVADIHPVSGIFSDLLLHDMGDDLQAPFPALFNQTSGGFISVFASRSNPDSGDVPVELISAQVFQGNPFPPSSSSRPSMGYYNSPTQAMPPLPYAAAKPDQPVFPRVKLSPEQLEGPARGTWDDLQREWKTPPLWGVADTAPYLHDGRAETLDEAILMHGGEALESRNAFDELDSKDKAKLIAFLGSLKAPRNTLSESVLTSHTE